jgi:nicotinate-nucleotide adenylyltransferase
MTASRRPRIGIFGGTFDPVHVGHLTLLHWARAELALDQILVIPTGRSWQKQQAGASAEQRLAMLQLALAKEPTLTIDDREVRRDGPSYTVDTLTALRAEIGPQAALVLVLGSDQLHNLSSWHRYRDLLSLAHLAVTQRENVRLSDFPAPVEQLLQLHGTQTLPDRPNGAMVFFRMPMMPVSATVLRKQLRNGLSPQQLVPPAVLDYIEQHRIYHQPSASDKA